MMQALLWLLLLGAPETEREIDYRCDKVRFDRKSNQAVCMGNVVLRRTDVLICCDTLTGDLEQQSNEAKSMLCEGNVRVQREGEYLWAKHATFDTKKSLLILRGEPTLQRARNILTGKRAKVFIDKDEAIVEKPVGRVQTSDAKVPPLPPFSRFSPVPESCTIPMGPKLR